jgi:hypothetical protein
MRLMRRMAGRGKTQRTGWAMLKKMICIFFLENRCQRESLAYTSWQMVGIKGLNVKKFDHFIPPRLARSNGSLKLPCRGI